MNPKKIFLEYILQHILEVEGIPTFKGGVRVAGETEKSDKKSNISPRRRLVFGESSRRIQTIDQAKNMSYTSSPLRVQMTREKNRQFKLINICVEIFSRSKHVSDNKTQSILILVAEHDS